MRKLIRLLGSLLCVCVTGANAQQMNCDCTQIVGSCEASIKVQSSGSHPSFRGDLFITATAPICAKVSYYVDTTPYFNILSRGNTDQDSVFGTKPVTRDTISDIRCQVCKTMTSARPEAGPQRSDTRDLKNPAELFQGVWTGKLDDGTSIVLRVNVNGNQISGSDVNDGAEGTFTDGVVNGDVLTFNWRTSGFFKVSGNTRVQLTGPGQARYTTSAGGTSLHGTVRKQ